MTYNLKTKNNLPNFFQLIVLFSSYVLALLVLFHIMYLPNKVLSGNFIGVIEKEFAAEAHRIVVTFGDNSVYNWASRDWFGRFSENQSTKTYKNKFLYKCL